MYSISYIPAALEDYEKSVLWYGERNLWAAEKFTKEVQEKILIIRQNPTQFVKKYRQYYESGLRKYPFSIIYIVDEKASKVIIVSIFHHKRNPKKKYKSK